MWGGLGVFKDGAVPPLWFMSLRSWKVLVLGLGLLSGIFSDARASSPWAELKAGMDGEATAGKIGWPVLSTRGRGVEVWIYDHCGEAVFKDGALLDWSVPVRESAAQADSAASGVSVVGVMPRPRSAGWSKAPGTRSRRPATVVVSSY